MKFPIVINFSKGDIQSIVAVILVVGCLSLAWKDGVYIPSFYDLSKVGIGGYLGQTIPHMFGSKKEDDK